MTTAPTTAPRAMVGLYQAVANDLRSTIKEISKDGYNYFVTPIAHPQFVRNFTDDQLQQRHMAFSRSDLILEANEWHQWVIAKISDYIDCDSPDESFRKHSERTLLQELSFAEHLQNGFVMLRLHSERTVNLARFVSRKIKSEFNINIFSIIIILKFKQHIERRQI